MNLIYIDPPFDSGADYVRKVSLRGPKGTAKLDGETYTLGRYDASFVPPLVPHRFWNASDRPMTRPVTRTAPPQ